MPVFATNTFADSTTPAANEAWTVNAGALATIATASGVTTITPDGTSETFLVTTNVDLERYKKWA